METITALVLCTVPTVWEIRNDRNGELKKDKTRDFLISVILYTGIALASLWMFATPVAQSLALMLAFRILCFDYAIQWYLIRRSVIVGHWFSYNGKTARFDRLVARINPWVRFAIRLLLFGGAIVYFASCSRVLTTSMSETSDSTHVKETLRMVPVKVPGEIVFANTRPLPCDPITLLPRPVVVQAQGKSAKAKAEIKPDGHLEITGGCDSLDAVIAAKDREIYRMRNEKKETVTPVFKTRRIDVFCRWFTGINILILIVALVRWIKKKVPFFKLPFIG